MNDNDYNYISEIEEELCATKTELEQVKAELNTLKEDYVVITCDVCGVYTEDPWHYSSGNCKHMHSCDECWDSVKASL